MKDGNVLALEKKKKCNKENYIEKIIKNDKKTHLFIISRHSTPPVKNKFVCGKRINLMDE